VISCSLRFRSKGSSARTRRFSYDSEWETVFGCLSIDWYDFLPQAPSTLWWRNFKTEVSLWKRIKCFLSTLYAGGIKKTQQLLVVLDLSCKLHDYRDATVFVKRFQNVFRPHENEKPAFSNFSGLKSVFEKLRFCHGLVSEVGLVVEIKLRFQISPT